MPTPLRFPQALTRLGLLLAATLAAAWMPASAQTGGVVTTAAPQLTVRAAGSPAAGGWPVMELRIDGVVAGRTEVRATEAVDFVFSTPGLRSGSRVDVVFTNDATSAGQDRNLYVYLLSDGRSSVLPTLPGAVIDRGSGAKAFDGQDVVPGQSGIFWSGALRLTWPAPAVTDPALRARRAEAARFLLQATFGPTPAEIDALAGSTAAQWINRQMAIPPRADHVDHVQAKSASGPWPPPPTTSCASAWRSRCTRSSWSSQADSNLYEHTAPMRATWTR
jgi:hypothetical protein